MEGRHIVAFGGLRPRPGETHALFRHVLSLTEKERPKVCCIPTATGDSAASVVAFYSWFQGTDVDTSHLALFNRTVQDIRTFLLSQDVIFVSGGNTANMLAVWRLHGVDIALRDAWESGFCCVAGARAHCAGSNVERRIRST